MIKSLIDMIIEMMIIINN